MFRLGRPGRSTQLKLALLSLSAGHSVIKFLRCSNTFQKLLSSSQPSGSRKDSPTMAMSFMMKGGGWGQFRARGRIWRLGGSGADGFRGKWTVRMDDTLKAKNDCGKRRSVSVQNESEGDKGMGRYSSYADN